MNARTATPADAGPLQILRSPLATILKTHENTVAGIPARRMLRVATMVNSHTDEAMVERIERIEKKLDDLAASIDRRFDAVGAEFDAVAGAFVEQRQYTEFAFSRLEAKMDGRFASVETRMDTGFAQVDSRFSTLEAGMDTRFAQVDSRFSTLEVKMDTRFGQADARFDRLERKLDDFIKKQGEANEAQRRANELVERRLNRLE